MVQNLPVCMSICFYIDPFRDIDFWPIARTALAEGHDIYYVLSNKTSKIEVVTQDRRTPFDLVVSSDCVSLD